MRDEADLLQADLSARRRAIDPGNSYIVQAPAGSGKTELLIQRYLALLETVEEPESVLAITFTLKAAGEMKRRVIAALEDARDQLSIGLPHEQLTRRLAERILRRDRTHDWRLIETPARLRVMTVDALNAGIARHRPLASGLAGQARVAGNAETATVYRLAATATLDHLSVQGVDGAAVRDVLVHLDGSVQRYVNYLARMLRIRDQWLGLTGSGSVANGGDEALRQTLEGNLHEAAAMHLRSVSRLIPRDWHERMPPLIRHAATNLRQRHEEGIAPKLLHIDSIPDIDDLEGWRGLADFCLTGNGTWRKQFTVREGFDRGDREQKQELADLLRSGRDLEDLRMALHRVRLLPNARYPDEQWQVLLSLFRLLPLAAAEVRRLFAERGSTDFVEVAMAARRALGSPEEPGDTALLLDSRICHLLIDEMQDTSIAQYDLLAMLTEGWSAGDGRTVFCVGDPMQSIYRFRNAEVGEFLGAREHGIGSVELEPLVLRQNFRSCETLVEWVNETFSGVFPKQDDVTTGSVAFAASVTGAGNSGKGHCKVRPVIDGTAVDEANACVDAVRWALARDGAGSVAVLVRARNHLDALLPELRAAEIGYEGVDIECLADRPEIGDLLSLARAISHRHDRIAWLALLRGPMVGLTWTDLHTLANADANAAIWQQVRNAAVVRRLSVDGRARVEHFATTMAACLRSDGTWSMRERVERAWYALGGAAALRSVDEYQAAVRFLELLDGVDDAGMIAEAGELESRLKNESVTTRFGDGPRIQVMTMHKAKGLEFDHVILHGLGHIGRQDDKNVLNWLNFPDRRGRSRTIAGPVASTTALDGDPVHKFIASTERLKSASELDRLLYVACTRARRTLQLVGNARLDKDGVSLRPPDGRTLLNRLWHRVRSDFEAVLDDDGRAKNANADAEQGVDLVHPPLRRLRTPWRAPDVPEPPGYGIPAMTRFTLSDVEFDWAGSVARYTGTLVHRILQQCASGAIEPGTALWQNALPIAGRWLAGQGIDDRAARPILERTRAALDRMARDDRGRWLMSSGGEAELALTGVIDGEVRSVVIDRVLEDDSGQVWLVDYKTGTHEGADRDTFLGEELRRYTEQLLTYGQLYEAYSSRRPKLALYFPLLQAFRPVSGGGNVQSESP